MPSKKSFLLVLLISFSVNIAQSSFYEPMKMDTVSWSIDDLGKMWTFDSVPVDAFYEKYGFRPTQEWLDDVRKSALQFGRGCSAAFVSEDGLIMTNHHCGRNQLKTVQKDDENILRDGFYAESPDEERQIKNLYVDQLIVIKDVTDVIKNFMKTGKTDDEKVKLRDQIKDSLITINSKETGLTYKVVTLYHGGKYSLYGYKRYNDVRLVMAPDFQIAATGWDWDNFTYPRYELDFMFYRAYDEEGKPINSNNYFSWNSDGAKEGEPIFVVGRPGSTDRLYSVAQLEYLRDYAYPNVLIGFNEIYDAYYRFYMNNTDKEELLNSVMGWGNSRKSYAGRLAGLNNNFIMKKKIEFQNDLIKKVNASPKLKEKYGHIWESIETVIKELNSLSAKNTVLRLSNYLRPQYYKLADEMVKIAEQKKLLNDERVEKYKDEKLSETIDDIFSDQFEVELEDNILAASVNFLSSVLDSNEPLLSEILNNKRGKEAVSYLKNNSEILIKEGFLNLAEKSPEEILETKDPFVNYILFIKNLSKEIKPKVKELNNTLSVLNELLGEVVFHVYGNKISPDATATLRISDGIISGYEYNGTIAPGKTSYYGLWDRFESFNKKTYPWGLHERWKTPPAELDLSTNVCFASTNDIVGGNSGSSAININKEVIGLVHDGNIESLAGHTIFLEENNRTVATDSKGLLEALKHIYKTERLVYELLNGKMK